MSADARYPRVTLRLSRHARERLAQRAPFAVPELAFEVPRRHACRALRTPRVQRKGEPRYFTTATAMLLTPPGKSTVMTVLRLPDEGLAELLTWLLTGCWP